eukprot:Selendium_serpulae@DN5565_c0_g1_i1.p1
MLKHWLTSLSPPSSGSLAGQEDPDNPWPSRHHDNNLVMKSDATKNEVLRFKEKIACFTWRDLQSHRVLMPLPQTPENMKVSGLTDCSNYYNRLQKCVSRQDEYDVSWSREYFHTLFTCKWFWGQFTRCVNYRDAQLLKQLVKWDKKQVMATKANFNNETSCKGYVTELESQVRYAKYMMHRTSAHPLNINFNKWEREEKNALTRLTSLKKQCKSQLGNNSAITQT